MSEWPERSYQRIADDHAAAVREEEKRVGKLYDACVRALTRGAEKWPWADDKEGFLEVAADMYDAVQYCRQRGEIA